MTIVDMPPSVNVLVAIGICLLTVAVVYFALIVGHKELDLGEEEEVMLYGRKAKPIFGRY